MKFLLNLFFAGVLIFSMYHPVFAEPIKMESSDKDTQLFPTEKKNTVVDCAKQEDSAVLDAKIKRSEEIYNRYIAIIESQRLMMIIDKSGYTLYLYKDGKVKKVYPIAVGLNPGQKQSVGDMTTPTGEFMVEAIYDSSSWTHDFEDGKGEIEAAYGPWFISLLTDWTGIGIHGTHSPSSIGTRASEGCIRMYNEDIEELKNLVEIYMKVIIIE